MIKQLNINKMKNLIYNKMKRMVVVLLVALTMIGCKEDNSIEGRITKAMKEYAQKNFDDPKSLKEIVSIEKTNVFDIDSLAHYTLEKSKEIDSLVKDLRSNLIDSTVLAELTNMSSREIYKMRQRTTESEMIRLLSLYMQISSYTSGDYYYKRLIVDNGFNNAMQNIDSVLKNNTFYSMNEYEIKIRKNSGDGLKLQSFYTSLCDTTTKIIISDHEPNISELEGESLYLKKQIDELLEYGQKKVEFATEEKKTLDEALFIINKIKNQ